MISQGVFNVGLGAAERVAATLAMQQQCRPLFSEQP
jgi:hypothetical protein